MSNIGATQFLKFVLSAVVGRGLSSLGQGLASSALGGLGADPLGSLFSQSGLGGVLESAGLGGLIGGGSSSSSSSLYLVMVDTVMRGLEVEGV